MRFKGLGALGLSAIVIGLLPGSRWPRSRP